MDREWTRILAVVALGLILPQLVVGIGSRQQVRQTGGTETTAAVEATEFVPPAETVRSTEAAPEPVCLPVVTAEDTVEWMDLEEYVRGVVLAEMPASFETEALKAQAVAARTYALRHLLVGNKHEQGAVCTRSTCCQAYLSDGDYLSKRGSSADWEKVAQAVKDTAGLVLTYEGKLADTTYFACSGGMTEDAEAVWGSYIPYLQAVQSPGEEQAASYEHEVYFSKAEFSALLDRPLTGSPTQWLGKMTYTDGGGVDTIVIGGITYTGKQLRTLLGLNSTAFTMTPDDEGITVTTKGKGHRVGMSQYGADAMAVLGSTYEEILAHYYQGTVIDKITEIG